MFIATGVMAGFMMYRETGKFVSGYRLAILQRGGTPVSYFWARISVDFLYTLLFGMMFLVLFLSMRISMGAMWLPFLMFAIAEPLWLNFWITLCKIRCDFSWSVIYILYGLCMLIGFIAG